MMSHCIGHAEGYRSIPTQPTTPDWGVGDAHAGVRACETDRYLFDCVVLQYIGQFLSVELGLQSCHSLAVSWLSATG